MDLGLNSLLAEVGNAPELLDSLSDLDAEYTIFGPTDEAFESLSDLDRPSSRDVLGGHIVNRTIFSSRLRQGQILTPFDEEYALHVTTVSTDGARVRHFPIVTLCTFISLLTLGYLHQWSKCHSGRCLPSKEWYRSCVVICDPSLQ